jgi:hypothetical protein
MSQTESQQTVRCEVCGATHNVHPTDVIGYRIDLCPTHRAIVETPERDRTKP